MSAHQDFIRLNGQRFHFYSWGDRAKPLVLMLHGFPEHGGAWREVATLLAPHFHCIAPDQRGYGQSWSPKGVSHYAASELIGDMAALISAFGGKAIVFGHDWGAAVAYGLAMFRSDLVERLIVANGVHPVPFQNALAAGGAQSEASQYIGYLRQEGIEKELAADGFARLLSLFSAHMDMSWLRDERLAEYRTAWKGAEQLGAMLNWYRASPLVVAKPGQPVTDLPALPVDRLSVPCPHLLLWGTDDTALLPEATVGLEGFAPDLTRVDIPDADHWLLHQRPDAVAREVLRWLER
jgi:pimeloyl-ACP methyl ester carboxylesterase